VLEIRFLGAFSIRSGKKELLLPSRMAQSLFAYLVMNAGTAFRREKLAGQHWPDSREEAARDYLRHALWRIRKGLESISSERYLHADDMTVTFAASQEYRLDTAVLLQAGTCTTADDLMNALLACGGELLPGFYDDWVVLEREHLQAVYEQEMGRLLGMLQDGGRWPETLVWAEKWIGFGHRPEPAYRALMLAHAAKGDMSKVAATYERCVKTLLDFGVQPSEQTKALYDDIKSGKTFVAAAPPDRSLPRNLVPSSNIPIPLTSFIGRQRELKKIAELLSASRLLTLTGPGGVGKTRLAIRAATDSIKVFRDGAFWVGLVGLADANLVPQEIAEALGVREVPSEPLEHTLITHLRSRELLLVMDNCEHLIQACAQAAEHLLAACPGLSILATSIEGLGLFNETVWQVPSLPLPRGQDDSTLDELRENESVRLFCERAKQASPAFRLEQENASFVAQICQRLDGIPLAIELAAARTKVLSASEIAGRLDDRFSLLTAGSRTAIPRHQTLRATLDWSHDLLAEPERILFRRQSVFAGGFTLEAAERVCGQDALQGAVLDLLGRLVDKSLVIVEPAAAGGETRYRLLETIRQYGLERLIAAGEAPTLRRLHVQFYLELAEVSESHVFRPDAMLWIARLDTELENFRSAIEWSTSAGKADLALRMLGALAYFWFSRGFLGSEWKDLVHQALARPEGSERTSIRAKALKSMGLTCWEDAHARERLPDLEEALSIAEELGDRFNIAMSLRYLGLLEDIDGNYAAARRLLGRSLEIWQEIGPEADLERAIGLIFVGDLAKHEGDLSAAKSLYEEAIAGLERVGDLNWRGYAVRRLAHLAWLAGEENKAFALCKESLDMNMQMADPRGIVACLAGFFSIATSVGEYANAAVLAGGVERQLTSTGIRLLLQDRLEFERNLASLRGHLGSKGFEKAYAKGQAMSLEAALAFALRASA
jgi:predicted ATPase/DNA-binding SARP family transcriptional activator